MKYRSKYDASLPCKEYMAKVVVQNYQFTAECLCVRPSLQIGVIQLRLFLYPQSSRRNWDSPIPSQAGECVPSPPLVPEGGNTRLRERGWGGGGSNLDDGTDTVVL
jgi:hypothetical protein